MEDNRGVVLRLDEVRYRFLVDGQELDVTGLMLENGVITFVNTNVGIYATDTGRLDRFSGFSVNGLMIYENDYIVSHGLVTQKDGFFRVGSTLLSSILLDNDTIMIGEK